MRELADAVEPVPAFSLRIGGCCSTSSSTAAGSARHTHERVERLPQTPRAALPHDKDPEQVAREQRAELTRLLEKEKVLVANARMRYRDAELRILLVSEAMQRRSGAIPDEQLSSLVAVGVPKGVNTVRYETVVRKCETEYILADPVVAAVRHEIAALRTALKVLTPREKMLADAEARQRREHARARTARLAGGVLQGAGSWVAPASAPPAVSPVMPPAPSLDQVLDAATTTPAPPSPLPSPRGQSLRSPRQRVSPHVSEALWSAPAAAAAAVGHSGMRRVSPFPRPWVDSRSYEADVKRLIVRPTTTLDGELGAPSSAGDQHGRTTAARVGALPSTPRNKHAATAVDDSAKAFLLTSKPLFAADARRPPIDYTSGARAAMETITGVGAVPTALHAPPPSLREWQEARPREERRKRAASARAHLAGR